MEEESVMSEQTPSQAEGERPEDAGTGSAQEQSGGGDAPRTTPSQAEGDRGDEGAKSGDEEEAEWESGWSGP
jgi:hypothetical protein